DRPRRGVDRDGEAEPDPGNRGVDAHDSPARIGKGATGVTRIQRRIRLDHVLDEPARTTVARREGAAKRADDTRGHRACEPEPIADGHDQLADLELRGIAETRRL